MAFQLGQKSGNYEFIDVVDSSPAKVAYRVRNLANNRTEMLRVLSKAQQDNREKVERFIRESRVHGRLDHPNIVRFYEAFVLDGQYVITTELPEGVTLKERLELGPLTPGDAAPIFRQALAALAYAHQTGVVHRDLRPSVLLIGPDGDVKLTGFDLAKSEHDARLTQAGAVLGEPHYMSPEQIRGTGALDPRSDLYSIAIVLFESLTGRRPFEAASQFDVMTAQIAAPPPLPSELQPGLPMGIDRLLLKALAKEPDHRFQSAGEFLHALESALTEPPVIVPPIESKSAPLADTPPPVSPRPVVMMMVVAGLLTMATLLLMR